MMTNGESGGECGSCASEGNGFRPSERIQRFFLSSPAPFTGSFTSDEFSLTVAFHGDVEESRKQIKSPSYSRQFFVLSINHGEWDTEKSVTAPDASSFAQAVSDLAAVWFGKEIRLHGDFQHIGSFKVPDLDFPTPRFPDMGPYNQEPRPDLDIALETSSLGGFIESLDSAVEGVQKKAILASHYYGRALEVAYQDIEVAYLQLVMAMEILSEEPDLPDEQLYDEGLRSSFDKISTLKGGDKIVRDLKSRLYQSRRTFAYGGKKLTGPPLFRGTEAEGNHGSLERGKITETLKSAYDVRSRHVHAGGRFGGHVTPHPSIHNEVVMGKPITPGSSMGKPLREAPTFLGLERIVRNAILEYLEGELGDVHPRLGERLYPGPASDNGYPRLSRGRTRSGFRDAKRRAGTWCGPGNPRSGRWRWAPHNRGGC